MKPTFGGPTGREENVLSFIKFEFVPNAALPPTRKVRSLHEYFAGTHPPNPTRGLDINAGKLKLSYMVPVWGFGVVSPAVLFGRTRARPPGSGRGVKNPPTG
jgi:hypothetical protein